jgi:hypothetical protein
MYDNVCVLVENARDSKLLALLGELEEGDKDLVIKFAESLVERYKNNMTNVICNFSLDKRKEVL